MNEPRNDVPFHAKKPYRIFSAILGLFLVGVGVYALLFAGPVTMLQFVGGSAFVLLGGNMALAAYRAKESWLSRIGPLP